MPLNSAKVGLAVQQHVSVVCATCEHYWRAQDAKAPTCGKACGGPVQNRSFPCYKGPISDFKRWCFVCGGETAHLVYTPGRHLGVCEKHAAMVRGWCAPFETHVIRLALEPVTPKKTLGQAIYEVEKFYADKEGREL